MPSNEPATARKPSASVSSHAHAEQRARHCQKAERVGVDIRIKHRLTGRLSGEWLVATTIDPGK